MEPNYVLGRGRLFFERFAEGQTTPTGQERYLGATSALTTTRNEQTLDHMNLEGGRKRIDRTATLQEDNNGAFTTDDISRENVALWLGGSGTDVVVAPGVGVVDTFEGVQRGTYLQLGISAASPSGARNVTNVVVEVAGAPVAAADNFEIDLALGRIYILPTSAGIADDADVEVTFDVVGGTEHVIIPNGARVEGALRFVADNEEGENQDRYWPHVRLTADGEHSLKGDDWQTMSFNFTSLTRQGQAPVVVTAR